MNRSRIELGEALLDRVERALELVEPLERRSKRVAVLAVVTLVPTRAEAEDQPTPGGMVNGSRHVGKQMRIAVAGAGHEDAELCPVRDLGHRRQRGPAFEVATGCISVHGEEVIPGEELIRAKLVGSLPDLAEPGVADLLGLDLRAHTDVSHGRGPVPARPQEAVLPLSSPPTARAEAATRSAAGSVRARWTSAFRQARL